MEGAGMVSLSDDTSGQFAGSDLLFEKPDCRAFVGERELGAGIIKITESELSWSSGETSETLTLEYPRICVHAVSRDTSAFPSPCVYVLYSASPPESESEEEQTDAEEPPPLEIRLVPSEEHHLEAIYSAICDCQLLYPDPDQSDSEEEGEEAESVEELEECPEDFFTSAEGLQHLTAEGEVVLAHLESILNIEDQSAENGTEANASLGQFEDAEEHTSN